MGILPKIEFGYASFTKSERRIADYLLDGQTGDMKSLTLSTLSHELGLGEATIIRFCKKLKLQGFQELKFCIALEGNKRAIEQSTGHDEIKRALQEAIEMTDSLASQQVIGEVIGLISDAAYVLFYGIGVSGLSASLGEMSLFRYGKRAHAITESHAQIMHASLCDDTCLLIALSVSGETKDLIEAVSLAQNNGARIVAITGNARSTLAKLSQYVLISAGFSNYISGGTSSTAISQMYTLDLLINGYASHHKNLILKYGEKVGWSMRNKFAH